MFESALKLRIRRYRPTFEKMERYCLENWEEPKFGLKGVEHELGWRFQCGPVYIYYRWLEVLGMCPTAYVWALRFWDLPELLKHEGYWNEKELWGQVYRRRYVELQHRRFGLQRFRQKIKLVYRFDFVGVRLAYQMAMGWNSFQMSYFMDGVERHYGVKASGEPGAVARRRRYSARGKPGSIG